MLSLPEDAWLSYFPTRLRGLLLASTPDTRRSWEEIRLRPGRPFVAMTRAGEMPLGTAGSFLSQEDLQTTFQSATQNSVYALEEELRRGFITLPGGHRLGFTGHAVLEGGRIRLLRQISSLNLRLARAVPGAGKAIVAALIRDGRILSTLILSAPRCGKTTLLRDLVRLVSTGMPSLGLSGQQVSLVDERSEVAGTYLAQPQLDVGPRTDVLDGAPKAEGMLLMLRSMSPDVLATDELGRLEDAEAVAEACKAGVAVLATAHADNPDEASRRPILGGLLMGGYFHRLVVLSRHHGPGTIEGVYWPGGGIDAGVKGCFGSWAPCSSWPVRAVSAI